MSSTAQNVPKIIPAQLGFLAIYNPSLGTNDEDLDNQIVYFSSTETRKRNRQQRSRVDGKKVKGPSQEEKNERLRQIGLAQGMVEFGKSFSEGKSIDTIETDKSRIILHELESGWWILAVSPFKILSRTCINLLQSIDLTRLPLATKPSASKDTAQDGNPAIEYSSREVKPAPLLLQDLLRAHSTFLLHHASSMSALFVRTQRSKFIRILDRYWNSYLSTWNVMLHGNPAVNVFGGIKLAASGELGVGVGEEDRGSGEREVLEGFVGRIEGLVDLVVSKFGDAESKIDEKILKSGASHGRAKSGKPWLGTRGEPASEDGAIFLGVGALSRNSLRDVSHWMEDLYSWGPHAYGVIENPSSIRQARNRKKKSNSHPKPPEDLESSDNPTPSGPPAQLPSKLGIRSKISTDEAISSTVEPSATANGDASGSNLLSEDKLPTLHRNSSSQSITSPSTTAADTMLSYFKLGYGTHWSLGLSQKGVTQSVGKQSDEDLGIPPPVANAIPTSPNPTNVRILPTEGTLDTSMYPQNDSVGHFLVGLMGDIESEESETEVAYTTGDEGAGDVSNCRTLLRTVTVELEREGDARAETEISIDLGSASSRTITKTGSSEHTNTSQGSYESQDRNKTKKLRVVVYVSRPFIYTFLFELRTDALALSSLYRSLHYQLGPLQKPLLVSTHHHMSRPDISTTTTSGDRDTPIYDLVWNPKTLIITSTIPGIPDPAYTGDNEKIWSRVEALNTHIQILNTRVTAKAHKLELERTSKTSRGWWVVWTRIPDIESPSLTPPWKQASDSYPSTPPLIQQGGGKSAGTSLSTAWMSEHSGPAHPFLEQISLQTEIYSPNKEILLIRRASDHSNSRSASRFVSGSSSGNEGWGSGSTPARLAQGIGVDTKRYIEGLLNMNR
jgi:hypothetical protein